MGSMGSYKPRSDRMGLWRTGNQTLSHESCSNLVEHFFGRHMFNPFNKSFKKTKRSVSVSGPVLEHGASLALGVVIRLGPHLEVVLLDDLRSIHKMAPNIQPEL